MGEPVDPMIDIISSGRILSEPDNHYGQPTVIDIDLELLATRLKTQLNLVIPFIYAIRERFAGATENIITQAIETAVNMMIDVAVLVCYNRLRAIAEVYNPAIRTARMNPRAPIDNRTEFPTFLSSLLGSIGPLRIKDGPSDMLVIYATSAERMQQYGRLNAPNLNYGLLERLVTTLRACNIALSPIDVRNTTTGSFFTTVIPTIDNHRHTYYASFHESHYENEDLVRCFAACHPDVNHRAFPFCGMMIGEVTNNAVLNALAAARPDGVDPAATADDDTEPLAYAYDVNYFGIRPAVAAAGTAPARARACWIVGRGINPAYRTILCRRITEVEFIQMLRHRILHPTV